MCKRYKNNTVESAKNREQSRLSFIISNLKAISDGLNINLVTVFDSVVLL